MLACGRAHGIRVRRVKRRNELCDMLGLWYHWAEFEMEFVVHNEMLVKA
jgi:hypothetical protein